MPEYITKERAMDCVYEAVKATDANAQDLYAIRRKIAKEPGIGWVSVKDRLPEKSGWYLVSLVNTRTGHRWEVPVSADYSHGKWDYSYLGVEDDATWILNNTVTHWMPLPKPPEEVNEDA